MSAVTQELETWLVRHESVRRNVLFEPGRVVGPWRLLIFFGRGGSGEVWRAEQVATGTVAAVKFLHVRTPAALARFQREIDVLRLTRVTMLEGIPRFIDCGEAEGIPYLALEVLEAFPLPSDEAEVARLILELVPTLASLHRLGVVHRDIKPTNLMGRRDAAGVLHPVLIDFGLLKNLDGAPLPREGTISLVSDQAVGVGTPGYAAPEQFAGGDISPATDIHALGMLINKCFHDNPPSAWQPIVRRCTSYVPRLRFTDVESLARAIVHRNRRRNVLRALAGCALAAFVFACAFWSVRAWALHDVHRRDMVYVEAGASQGGDGTKQRPFESIQMGINMVNPEGDVYVGPGVYNEALMFWSHKVRLMSTAGPERTIVRGHEYVPVVYVTSRASGSEVIGFTFTGGTGLHGPMACSDSESSETDDETWRFSGGGIACSHARVRFLDCHIVGNGLSPNAAFRPEVGGGVWANMASVFLSNCVISNNYACLAGGGVAAFVDTEEQKSHEWWVTLAGTTIADNRVRPQLRRLTLGGVALLYGAAVEIRDSTLYGNRGEQVGSFGGIHSLADVSFKACKVQGGAKPNGVQNFRSDESSRVDYRP